MKMVKTVLYHFRSFFFWYLMYVLAVSNQPVIISRIN